MYRQILKEGSCYPTNVPTLYLFVMGQGCYKCEFIIHCHLCLQLDGHPLLQLVPSSDRHKTFK